MILANIIFLIQNVDYVRIKLLVVLFVIKLVGIALNVKDKFHQLFLITSLFVNAQIIIFYFLTKLVKAILVKMKQF